MVRTGDILGEVGNAHIILYFAQINVIMEVKPHMEVMFVKGKV